MIKLNYIFNGFRWTDKDKDFDNTYTQPNTRKNYHVLLYNNKWTVHSEASKEIEEFVDKDLAIAYAKKQAELEKTEAIIHNEKNIIEYSWIYDFSAYPQEKIYPPEKYPLQDHPGKKVL